MSSKRRAGMVENLPPICVIARVNQVLDRAWKIPALLEVNRELRRDLRRTFAVVTQQLLARLLVQ